VFLCGDDLLGISSCRVQYFFLKDEMIMQLRCIQLALLTVCAIVITNETSGQPIMDSLRFEDRLWAMKKKAVILEYMDMTEAEKAAFWPVYESYYNAMQYTEMESIYLLSLYAKGLHTLSGQELDNLSTRILQDDLILAKTRKQYFKKFKKALSVRQATAFMQLDNEFRTMRRINIQKDSPTMEILQVELHAKASLK
jgi:hypothetical protein